MSDSAFVSIPTILLVKDCKCDAPSSAGQAWTSAERTPTTLTIVSCFEPRMACEKCHKPWRKP